MTKSLQILFGLVLILVLAYVAFLDVSTKIKDDLLTKAKIKLSEHNVRDVAANIQGEGSTVSRTLVLTGTAISEVERVRIVTLIENVEGVCSVDNQIELYPVVPKAPKIPSVPRVPTAIKIPVLKTSTEPVITKSTAKEEVLIKSIEKKELTVPTNISPKVPLVPVIEETTAITSVSSTKVPTVPTVENKSIVVPTPVRAIDAPKVIEVEKIKLEGVK